MPRPPNISKHIGSMPPRVFSKYADRIRRMTGEVYALHVGDTYLLPVQGAHMENLKSCENDGWNRYSAPHGHPKLIGAIELRYQRKPAEILVVSGATAGLHALASTTLSPGDEVLILAPYWPLIAGIVQLSGATPISVPFFDRTGSVTDRIAPFINEKTTALYVNTPNNPTGRCLDLKEAKAIADLARQENLWLWSDEVYEEIVYEREHIRIADLAPERSVAVYSFSKAYGMAGNRCGYLLGPANLLSEVRKAVVHSTYSTTTASQLAGAYALEHGREWISDAKSRYHKAGVKAANALGVPSPEGGTFLFLNIAENLDARGVDGFLSDCIDRNLLLAPGASFGRQYKDFVRICFTSQPEEQVMEGVSILREMLGRGQS